MFMKGCKETLDIQVKKLSAVPIGTLRNFHRALTYRRV